MSMYNFKLYSATTTELGIVKMSNKPSRAAPPPPVPSHAKNDRNNNSRNHQRQARDGVAKIPTVIRPKMVETPKKKAPPRPPPPLMDASFVPTRTSSLNRGVPPPVPPPPINKSSKQRGLHINTKALRKVKIFGKSSSKSASSNANGEFFTATMGNGRFGGSYTNQALSQPTRGKKQAPMPPAGSTNFSASQVATGTLISFDTPPTSPGCVAPSKTNGSSNVQSLLDMDFPEPSRTGGASLLDMDIPPMISTSLSVDNFGSSPFDPFRSEPRRKASLPVTTSKLSQPVMRTPEALGRISQIREEWSTPHENSPPPPRCPAPQLNPLDTSVVTTQPCAMALADYTNPKKGELSYSQYELIELLAEHDDFYYLGRLDDQDGLVRKDAVEVLTPLEDSQQDSEPESQQDSGYRHRPSSSTSTGDATTTTRAPPSLRQKNGVPLSDVNYEILRGCVSSAAKAAF
ncbi:protein ENL [Galendromus occidentalis]|uniref:Protein ENL n=1 Tax=Galendromus occidentalis TaxID=34638 RepID=A0AAJ6QTN7_9ACAR|nr:protein ENL [Galendromus occidentalis]